MKKIKRYILRSKCLISELNHSKKGMVEATKDNVVNENVDVVGGLMITTIKKEKYHQQVVGEELQKQGMISYKSNDTTMRILGIMLLNVELLAIVELKRRPTVLKK